MSRWTAHHATVLAALALMPDASADAILSDVPYGLGTHQPSRDELIAYLGGAELDTGGDFMGRDWNVPSVHTWSEMLRVMKPGAWAVIFAGPRTVDLISIGMRAAGFEIRDVITYAWWFGTGFPKSQDASIAIDKAAGAERSKGAEKVYSGDTHPIRAHGSDLGLMYRDRKPEEWAEAGRFETVPTTDLARAWDGYGTALKPAYEPILCGYKPLTVTQHLAILMSAITDLIAMRVQWNSSLADGAAKTFLDIRARFEEAQRSVLEHAKTKSLVSIGLANGAVAASTCPPVERLAPRADSALSHVSQRPCEGRTSDQTTEPGPAADSLIGIVGICTSVMRGNTSESIVSSWLRISDVVLSQANTFTISTATRLTTALRILSLSLLPSTSEDIGSSSASPAFEPIILARKPLIGTLAENIAAHGTGALAIDASRIETEGRPMRIAASRAGGAVSFGGVSGASKAAGEAANIEGRWPSNLLLDATVGSMLDAQTGDRPGMASGGQHRAGYAGGMFGAIDGNAKHARGDTGGASRFFYVAKATREERDLGCEHLPLRSAADVTGSQDGAARLDSPRTGAGRTSGARNHHPTVKPVDLTRWLAGLILPPAQAGRERRIVVPYAGSGSEMIGALLAGWDLVEGIEREAEFMPILRARVTLAASNPRAFEPFADRKSETVDPRQVDLFGKVG